MRSLSSALSAAFGAPVQQPALLARIDFSSPKRYSSFADVDWDGKTWRRAPGLEVQRLSVQALRVTGTLVIGNADDVIAALVLNEGVADRPISIWAYDAGATADVDVVLLCEAVGAAARVGPQGVEIDLRAPSEFLLSPRTRVNAAAGFTSLLPAGSVLRINGQDYRLEGR